MKKKNRKEEQSRSQSKQCKAQQTHRNESVRMRASTRATELNETETKERRNEKPLTDETMHRGRGNELSPSLHSLHVLFNSATKERRNEKRESERERG